MIIHAVGFNPQDIFSSDEALKLAKRFKEFESLLDKLKEKTGELPQVLFLDLNMPRKNGFECLTEIKSSEKLKELPVIIFSTSFEQDVVNLLYKKGGHYYIRKPAEFSQLKKVILEALTLIAQGNISQPPREDFVITGNENGVA